MSGTGTVAIYGPEAWASSHGTVWSHWDLWFCVVAIADHECDLDAPATAIENHGRTFGGATVESKLSHLDDLKRRLADAGIDTYALAAGEETEPKTRTKARAKVLKQGLYPRDMTEPMSHTPRQRLHERALRGRWHLFRVSPEPYYQRLSKGLGEGFRSKDQTFKLASRLEAAIERLDRTTANSAPQRLAARRALISWCYRAMERCDDCYGVIGEVGTDALLSYASFDYQPAGISGEAWCEDLCELLSWENWGLLLRAETRPFAQLRGELAEHAEQFMLSLGDELRAHRLRYDADQTLQNVAHLHIAAGRLTRFAPVAQQLGSDHWMPIVALAQAAIKHGRHDIAREVFAAADQPGLHRDYLRERCIELTGQPPARRTIVPDRDTPANSRVIRCIGQIAAHITPRQPPRARVPASAAPPNANAAAGAGRVGGPDSRRRWIESDSPAHERAIVCDVRTVGPTRSRGCPLSRSWRRARLLSFGPRHLSPGESGVADLMRERPMAVHAAD